MVYIYDNLNNRYVGPFRDCDRENIRELCQMAPQYLSVTDFILVTAPLISFDVWVTQGHRQHVLRSAMQLPGTAAGDNLRDLLRQALTVLQDHQDVHNAGGGWKSPALETLIAKIEEALSANQAESP